MSSREGLRPFAGQPSSAFSSVFPLKTGETGAARDVDIRARPSRAIADLARSTSDLIDRVRGPRVRSVRSMETRVPGSPAPHDLFPRKRVLRFFLPFPATNGHRGDGASPALTRSSPRRCSPRIEVVVAHRTRNARATPRSDTRVSTARVVSEVRKDAGYFPPPPPKYPYATLTKYNSPPSPRRRRRRFQTASTKGGRFTTRR